MTHYQFTLSIYTQSNTSPCPYLSVDFSTDSPADNTVFIVVGALIFVFILACEVCIYMKCILFGILMHKLKFN